MPRRGHLTERAFSSRTRGRCACSTHSGMRPSRSALVPLRTDAAAIAPNGHLSRGVARHLARVSFGSFPGSDRTRTPPEDSLPGLATSTISRGRPMGAGSWRRGWTQTSGSSSAPTVGASAPSRTSRSSSALAPFRAWRAGAARPEVVSSARARAGDTRPRRSGLDGAARGVSPAPTGARCRVRASLLLPLGLVAHVNERGSAPA